MKILVCGSRNYEDKIYFDLFLDGILNSIKDKFNVQDKFIIISGMAKGADTLAVQYAKSREYDLEEHPADWDAYGKMAGYKRNSDMVKEADFTIAFYKDVETKGTKHTVSLSKKKNIPVVVVLNRKVIFSSGIKEDVS